MENKIPRVSAIDRNQMILRPVNIERLIEADHSARGIWQLVGSLDLSPFYEVIEAVEGEAGRPAHDPQLLICLLIYSYTVGVASAREISRRCQWDPAYQWLTALNGVNPHTLSDFRVQHAEALSKLAAEVLGVLSCAGLVQLKRAVHDGTKVQASASGSSFRREKTLRRHIEAAGEQIQQLEQEAESEEASKRKQAAQRRAARERKERLEKAAKELEEVRAHSEKPAAECRVSETDPQARVMKHGDGGYNPSYNVQITTDGDSGVIVAMGVSQSAGDQGLLPEALDRVQEKIGRLPEQVLVDGGFITAETVAGVEEKGIELIGPAEEEPKAAVTQKGIDPEFSVQAFSYVAEEDVFICPAGKKLQFVYREKCSGGTRYRYQARAEDCQNCVFKSKCCPKSSKGRRVMRQVVAPALAAFRQNMQTERAKEIYRGRGGIEFVNLWIKAKIGLRQFSVRGLEKVSMEALWVCLTYNIQQWLRLCWRARQLQACT